MPASKRTPWLICYDIADPARLGRVHKRVRQYATPLQYSVFRVYAARREVAGSLGQLAQVVNPALDDVRAYPLLTASIPAIYGRALVADGIHLVHRHTLFDSPDQEPWE